MNLEDTFCLLLQKATEAGASSIWAMEDPEGFTLRVWLGCTAAGRMLFRGEVKEHLPAWCYLEVFNDEPEVGPMVIVKQRSAGDTIVTIDSPEKARELYGWHLPAEMFESKPPISVAEWTERQMADLNRRIVAECCLPRRMTEEPEKPATQSLAERYPSFRAAVERVVYEQAPRAKVVTDLTQRTPTNAPVLLYEIRIGSVDLSGTCSEDMWRKDSEFWLGTLRADVSDALRKVGARAMGKDPG